MSTRVDFLTDGWLIPFCDSYILTFWDYFLDLVFVPVPYYSVGNAICFRLSVLSVCPDRSCNHDIWRSAWAISTKLTWDIHQPLLMTWLDSSGQRSRFRRSGEGVNVDDVALSPSFSF